MCLRLKEQKKNVNICIYTLMKFVGVKEMFFW